MKLKIYKISSIVSLFLSLILSITFLILTIVNISSSTGEILDKIMYIVCFVLLIAFITMEIINSIISIKKGSQFVKNLAYDDINKINRNFLIILGGGLIILLAGIIYFILLLYNINMPLKDMAIEIKYIILCYLIVLFIDSCIILLFPIFGKDDQSMQENN